MYAAINGTGNNKSVYIMESFRKEDGRTSSRVFRKLGKLDALLEEFNGDKEKMMEWAKAEAIKDTEIHSKKSSMVTVSLSQSAYIPLNEERSFNVGYLFLQKLCSELRMDNICRNIKY